jgi:probable F420-dependent oxidoreductase
VACDDVRVRDGVSFAVQAAPAAGAWSDLARRVESAGFEALCVADHPGLTVSPFVALAAAAPVTTSLRLGTSVLNSGVREPFDIANDAAALDLVSAGRALLGLGAGHTPAEWSAVGRAYPSAAKRVERLAALIPLVQQLLAGEIVTYEGPQFRLVNARLEFPPRRAIPLLVGGNGPELVRVGAAHADIVEIGGLGRTLPDGHFHEPRWKAAQIDRVVGAFHEAAGARRPRLGALVQFVAVTDHAEAAMAKLLASLAEHLPPAALPTIEDLLVAPFVLIGSVEEITNKILQARHRWGLVRYTVRAAAINDIVEVMTALRAAGQLAETAA